MADTFEFGKRLLGGMKITTSPLVPRDKIVLVHEGELLLHPDLASGVVGVVSGDPLGHPEPLDNVHLKLREHHARQAEASNRIVATDEPKIPTGRIRRKFRSEAKDE